MKRTALAIVALMLAAVVVSCEQPRMPTRAEAAHDGAVGATIGGMFGGPAGATIGGGIAIAIGVVVRSLERSKLKQHHAEEKSALTRGFAHQLETLVTGSSTMTARTEPYRASEALMRNTDSEV